MATAMIPPKPIAALGDGPAAKKSSRQISRPKGGVVVTIRRLPLERSPRSSRTSSIRREMEAPDLSPGLPSLQAPSTGKEETARPMPSRKPEIALLQTDPHQVGREDAPGNSTNSSDGLARHSYKRMVRTTARTPRPRPAPLGEVVLVRLHLSTSSGGVTALMRTQRMKMAATCMTPVNGAPGSTLNSPSSIETLLHTQGTTSMHRLASHKHRKLPKCSCSMLPLLLAAGEGGDSREKPTPVHRWPCKLSETQGFALATVAGSRQELENARFAQKQAKWEAANRARLAKLQQKLLDEERTPSPPHRPPRGVRVPTMPRVPPPSARTPRAAKAVEKPARSRVVERERQAAAKTAEEALLSAEESARLAAHERISGAIRSQLLVRERKEAVHAAATLQGAWRLACRLAERRHQDRMQRTQEQRKALVREVAAVRIQAIYRGARERWANRPMQLEMTLGCHGIVRGLGQLDELLCGVTARLAALDATDYLLEPLPPPDEPLQIVHELVAEEARQAVLREAEARETEREREAQRQRGEIIFPLTLVQGVPLNLTLSCHPVGKGLVLIPLWCEASGMRDGVPLMLQVACSEEE